MPEPAETEQSFNKRLGPMALRHAKIETGLRGGFEISDDRSTKPRSACALLYVHGSYTKTGRP